jgi:hypothetical protein
VLAGVPLEPEGRLKEEKDILELKKGLRENFKITMHFS